MYEETKYSIYLQIVQLKHANYMAIDVKRKH